MYYPNQDEILPVLIKDMNEFTAWVLSYNIVDLFPEGLYQCTCDEFNDGHIPCPHMFALSIRNKQAEPMSGVMDEGPSVSYSEITKTLMSRLKTFVLPPSVE